MSFARIAALHRELAEAYDELAASERAEERPAPARRPRILTPPAGEADEVTRARAKRLLHQRGYREVPK